MPKPTPTEQVTTHIQTLPSDTADIVQYLRNTILATDSEIAEQIKWNSPAFYYTGEMAPFDPKEYKRDLIVMNLHRGKILLVLPTGARLTGAESLLEGDYKDGRRLITIKDLADAKAKTPALRATIRQWLSLIEK
jgi:hypothetical protein